MKKFDILFSSVNFILRYYLYISAFYMTKQLRCRLFDAAGIVNSIYIQLKRLFLA